MGKVIRDIFGVDSGKKENKYSNTRQMQSSELPIRVEKLFLKGVKTEAASGVCRENARYIEILELMTLKILAKHDVNRMINCVLMATIIVLTYAHCEGKLKSAHF